MAITKSDLAREVSELLDLPKHARRNQTDEPYRIVLAVLESVTNALQKGQSVTIHGLGKFSIRTKKARKSTGYLFGAGRAKISIQVPERTYVHFRPANSIMRTLNA